LLVIYNGYITKYGGSSLPTSILTGTLTFTNGSTAVSAIGGAFVSKIIPKISYVRYLGGNWLRVESVIDNDNLLLEQPFSEVGGTGTSIETMDPFFHTQYRYTLTYITQNIINKQDPNRLIVYYDGDKYYDKQKNSYCIFHYDLGEFAKTIGLNDEDYAITVSNNMMLIQPYGVKEVTGQSTWANGTDTIVGFNTFYTTELSIGDWIKPSSIGTAWYQVLNIVDDLNLQLSSNYAGITVTNIVTDKQNVIYTPLTITLTTGTRTADQIAQEINDQIGQQSTIEAVFTGVVTFTNGDATVSAVGGNFDAEVKPGDWIRPTGTLTWYQVKYVHTNDDLELKTTFAGVTVSGNADKGYSPVILSWGIPVGFNTGFVRLLANIRLNTLTREKGAILLDAIANDAYTVLGFDKLYSKASICFMLYNPSPTNTLLINSLTGNMTFTNGSNSVTGSGTLFLTEVKTGDLVRCSTDPESDYAYVTQVINNTSLTLDGNYTGIGGTTSDNKALRISYNSRITGTVSFINGNTSVTGVNTSFTTELIAGDMIRLPGDTTWGTINNIVDNFNLQLVSGYGGTTGTSTFGTTRKIKAINYNLSSFSLQEDLLLAEIGA
jgi:hypothetical protein